MANNVPISSGVGTSVATDDVSGVHVQLVKLVDGTEDSAARIPGSAALGLLTRVSQIAPATTLTASKVTVTTASTQLVAANVNRRVAMIQVVSGGPVYIRSGTATTNDFPVATGGVYEHQNTSALSGIVASGSADIRILEES